MALGSMRSLSLVPSIDHNIPDHFLEESKPDIPILPSKEAYSSILYPHILVRDPSYGHVRPRSQSTGVGDLLLAPNNVDIEHFP